MPPLLRGKDLELSKVTVALARCRVAACAEQVCGLVVETKGLDRRDHRPPTSARYE
jgi:hypothetical protein